MYRKVWRVYTGVVHPYMRQQVARTTLGSSPMELDAFRQRPRSPQPENQLWEVSTRTRVNEKLPKRSENILRDNPRSERRWKTRERGEAHRGITSDSSLSPRGRRDDRRSDHESDGSVRRNPQGNLRLKSEGAIIVVNLGTELSSVGHGRIVWVHWIERIETFTKKCPI